MSLKTVHLVFVCALTALALACAGWEFKVYCSPAGTGHDLWFALGAIVVAVAVIVYGRYFLKKLKRISYL